MSVCVVYEWEVGEQVNAYRSQRRTLGALLDPSPLRAFDTGSLLQPGARLAASKPSGPPASALNSPGGSGTQDHLQLFVWWGFELRSSCLCYEPPFQTLPLTSYSLWFPGDLCPAVNSFSALHTCFSVLTVVDTFP